MNKRKICIVTGTRAEFGLLKPVMEKIRDSDTLRLQVIVTGMHLLPEYGETVSEISRSGIPIDGKVPMTVAGDDKTAMSLSIGLGIISFTQVLNKLDPDIVLVLGDRFEIFSAAIAASFGGRVVAHISGGDSLQAGYDEYVRHAVTKISHIHFPSTEQSAARIVNLGEDPEKVFTVGSTALDTILHRQLPAKKELCEKYGSFFEHEFALVIQHPISTDPNQSQHEMMETIESLLEFDIRILIIYPNNDPGGKKIIDVIDQYVAKYPGKIIAYKSIPFEDYLGILKISSIMVGNSSSGIIESSSFHIPVVNIGDRQNGRERSCNVVDSPHDKERITNAIRTALFDNSFRKTVSQCQNPYGKGYASEKIVEVLSNIDINTELLKKKITY